MKMVPRVSKLGNLLYLYHTKYKEWGKIICTTKLPKTMLVYITFSEASSNY